MRERERGGKRKKKRKSWIVGMDGWGGGNGDGSRIWFGE